MHPQAMSRTCGWPVSLLSVCGSPSSFQELKASRFVSDHLLHGRLRISNDAAEKGYVITGPSLHPLHLSLLSRPRAALVVASYGIESVSRQQRARIALVNTCP